MIPTWQAQVFRLLFIFWNNWCFSFVLWYDYGEKSWQGFKGGDQCDKRNQPEAENALPQAPTKDKLNDTSMTNSAFSAIEPEQEHPIEATAEEKANVKNLLASLGL